MSAPYPTRARMLATIYLCSFALYVGCEVISVWLRGGHGSRDGTNPAQRIVSRSGRAAFVDRVVTPAPQSPDRRTPNFIARVTAQSTGHRATTGD